MTTGAAGHVVRIPTDRIIEQTVALVSWLESEELQPPLRRIRADQLDTAGSPCYYYDGDHMCWVFGDAEQAMEFALRFL